MLLKTIVVFWLVLNQTNSLHTYLASREKVNQHVSNQATYAAIVGDNSNSCLVQSNWHRGNETRYILSDIVEITLLDRRGRIENEIKVDAQIIGAAVFFAAHWNIAAPLSILTDAVWVVGNADLGKLSVLN